MRRMLDPTKIGEGGDEKLYCHHMRVGPKDGGEIFFDYYSTTETKFTKETMLSAMKDKYLICTGYVKVNDSVKTLEFIYVNNTTFRVKWIDLTTLVSSTKDIDISYLSDTVFPVS